MNVISDMWQKATKQALAKSPETTVESSHRTRRVLHEGERRGKKTPPSTISCGCQILVIVRASDTRVKANVGELCLQSRLPVNFLNTEALVRVKGHFCSYNHTFSYVTRGRQKRYSVAK